MIPIVTLAFRNAGAQWPVLSRNFGFASLNFGLLWVTAPKSEGFL